MLEGKNNVEGGHSRRHRYSPYDHAIIGTLIAHHDLNIRLHQAKKKCGHFYEKAEVPFKAGVISYKMVNRLVL